MVELLVVIAILGLIASLVGPQVMKHFAGAKTDAARLQIADFSAALDLYYLDVGEYPSTNDGLRALVTRPDSAATWNGPYLKKVALPVDPWGRAYEYVSPGDNGPYEIVSRGADGKAGGDGDGADIVSWE